VSEKGVVLSGEDQNIEARAAKLGLGVTIDASMPLAYDKTLFVTAGAKVPWDMLDAGWHFLDKWDAAAPLWKHGITGAKVGTSAERKLTEKIIHDLRVPLYAHELLFVRNNEVGQALMEAFNTERTEDGEPRLAFLRAFYQVKPRLCALPATWLSDVSKRQITRADIRAAGGRRSRPKNRVQNTGRRNEGRALVQVEIAPGKYVQCYAGDEDQVVAEYEKRKSRSRADRRRG